MTAMNETIAPWGAFPEEWDHLTLVLGLTEDLLPVVSNPEPPIAATSSLSEKGKVPSVYTARREIVGILDWTSKRTTDRNVEAWSREPDFGICIQTRTVKALDVDVADRDQARRIEERVLEVAPCLAGAARRRSNSGKFLLAFALPGEYGKRTMEVEGGVIEFLANGQQFIAAGTHPSGVRYEWDGGLPGEMPTLDAETFERLWATLAAEFATAAPTERRLRREGSGAVTTGTDETADAIRSRGIALGEGPGGQLFIRCPWSDQHTHQGDERDTSTAYFPRGTGGYERGHFMCLHAHCASRTDDQFEDALGLRVKDFEVVKAGADEPPLLPAFKRSVKTGQILATVDNLQMALRRPDMTGMRLGFDTFRDEIMYARRPGEWEPFTDEQYVELRITLERRDMAPVGRELIRDVVALVAKGHTFNSAQAWLVALEWDQQPRIDTFFSTYMGAEDSVYVRAVAQYIWTAMAGRVMTPGCKADMVPILVGGQGIGKSSAVGALVPSPDHFTEVGFHEQESDQSRKMRGRLVAELSELRGIHSREMESIKAFITRTHEHWTPKYREFTTTFARSLVFWGTTNADEFLADETGNRRWLPVRVGKAEVDAIRADREQLWAEALARWYVRGVMWHDAERLAGDAHDEHTIRDVWEDAVNKWLDEPEFGGSDTPRQRPFLKPADIFEGALGMDAKHCKRADEQRMGKVLRTLGYQRVRKFVDCKQMRVWVTN
jgi:hypothetical protein